MTLAHLNRSPIPPLLTLLGLSAVMFWRLGWPILILVVPFAMAYAGWLVYGWSRPVWATPRLSQWLTLLIAAQILHFSEEYLTRFQSAFPAFWGQFWHGQPTLYAAWDTDFFAFGNLLMQALWLTALTLLTRKNAWANYMVWLFLAGMLTNIIQHPFYAVYTGLHTEFRAYVPATSLLGGWYFPGLFTVGLHTILFPVVVAEMRRASA